jgi:hypothetical protein
MKYMVIKWLYDNYVGLRSSKITVPATEKTWPFVKFVKVNVVRVKAARIMFPFFVLWVLTKFGHQRSFANSNGVDR